MFIKRKYSDPQCTYLHTYTYIHILKNINKDLCKWPLAFRYVNETTYKSAYMHMYVRLCE